MFSYEAAEDDIYNRLKVFESVNVEVEKLPENHKNFKRPYEKAKITVGYKGSKWEKTKSTQQIAQDEKLTFELALQSKVLRGPRGLYNLKRLVTVALVGFAPTDCDRMTADESGMTGVTETLVDGVWTYTMLFCTTTLTVEDFEEDLTVLLTKITNKMPYGDPDVVVE